MKPIILRIVQLALLLAAIWAVSVSFYIYFTPLQVESLTATSDQGGEGVGEMVSQEVSWYAAQGVWGIFILVIFAALYVGAALLIWRRKYISGGVWIALALVLTYLAGFSIGPFYFPSAVLFAIGGFLLLVSAFLPGGSQGAPDIVESGGRRKDQSGSAGGSV